MKRDKVQLRLWEGNCSLLKAHDEKVEGLWNSVCIFEVNTKFDKNWKRNDFYGHCNCLNRSNGTMSSSLYLNHS